MTEEELMNTKVAEAANIYGEAPKIDLSLVKNAKAAKISKEFNEKIGSSIKRQKKNKFCFTEEHEVQLPSNGKLYQSFEDEDIKNGVVRLKPMSLADEETLANQNYIKNGTVFSHLLESCVCNNINVKKLIPYDVFYLLYTLRKITYGEDYNFEVECPECGKKYNKTINISDVEWQELTEEEDIVKTIKLPVSKYTITIEASTLGNEEEVNRLAKTSDAGDVILNYVARTQEILDEDGEPVNPKDFVDFFEALPGRDRAEISKAFETIDGLEIPTIDLVCPKCGEEDKTSIPFNKSFFRY
jgi:rubredoxin